MDFADYERRLALLQGALQRIQQAYLGTSERALLVLEGWDTAGKGGLVRRLGWALDPRSWMLLRTSPIRRLSDSIVTDGSEMIRCEGRRDFSMSMIDGSG